MKYKCIPCNHEFEVKEGAKPRCPRCLKIHDVEPLEGGEATAKTGSSRLLVPAVALIVAGIVGAVYVTMKKNDGETPKATAVDAENVLEKAGIPAAERVKPCAAGDAVTALAKRIADGKDGEAGLDALYNGISAFKEQNLWTPHPQREPRKEKPLTAEQFAKRLSKSSDADPWQATSYELACLLLASARALDIDAKMVEVLQFKGEKRPADGPGKFGRYAVALNADPEKSDAVSVYDIYGSRAKSGATAKVVVLDENGAMAPYFGISALSLLVKQEMSEALQQSDLAIKLDDKNPYFRATRGFIFAATGVPSESLVEFEKALKSRTDPVQRVNLAEILLLINPMDKRAETEVQAALKEAPDFARAHALKAMIHLVRQEKDQAATELTLAERLDPKSPTIAMYWARYYSITMDSEQAVAKAKQAVALSGNSTSMLLGLAGIYREVAHFDDMRSTLDQIYAQMETPQMAEQIKQVFGYDPAPEPETAADDDNAKAKDAPSSGSDYQLKLGEGFGGNKAPALGGGGLSGSGGLGGGGGLGGSGSPSLGGDLDLDLNLQK